MRLRDMKDRLNGQQRRIERLEEALRFCMLAATTAQLEAESCNEQCGFEGEAIETIIAKISTLGLDND